tara:strand:- start:14345 stop:16258 length:1914 start_codon:yes stop_codon:yes gene_type:complete
MTDTDDLTPHLGRIRDVGKRGGKRAAKQLRRAVAKLPKRRAKSGFQGKRHGAGGAARGRPRTTRHLPRYRLRRVMVKVHIARAAKSGAGVYRAHLSYIQRDGVDRNGDGGKLYDRESDELSAKKFLERSENDRHQFRLIVSPEDGVALGDLKPAIRELMTRIEKDTGRRLDWVAVDHHNTGHPHTHIVIRGRDARMKDVVIAKDYLMNGIREAAEDIVTGRLGPRRDLEILRARNSEIGKDRLTGIDRMLERASRDGLIELPPATPEAARFERHLALSRLRHLSELGLAERGENNEWRMTPGWTETLREMGRRGDIVRTLAQADGKRRKFDYAENLAPDAAPILGTVLASGPEDELRDTRFLLVEDFKGRVWHVPAAAVDPENPPPTGAVVEVSRNSAEPKRADRTIAEIAERAGGLWSETLHEDYDPASTPAYRLAHKRRLEALRRAGIVERLQDGTWTVPGDYLERATAYEAARNRGLHLRTLSWVALDRQVTLHAETWLDAGQGEGERLSGLRAARLAFLRTEGLLKEGETELSDTARQSMRHSELQRTSEAETKKSGRAAVMLDIGDRFDGKLEGHVDLGQGRMALIVHEKAFVLVPWRSAFGRQLGREMTIEHTARGIGWTIGREMQRGFGG